MRSRPHNALHLEVGYSVTSTLANAMEVRRVSRCRFHARYRRRRRESGDGDIQGRERYSSQARNPNTGARARHTTSNRVLIFL